MTLIKERVHTHQTTDSYDSDVLGGGSCSVVLEWTEDGNTATQHRRNHSGWDLFGDLQQGAVRQGISNISCSFGARLDDEVGGNTSVVGVLEHK